MTTARIETDDVVIEVEDDDPRVASGQALRIYERITGTRFETDEFPMSIPAGHAEVTGTKPPTPEEIREHFNIE